MIAVNKRAEKQLSIRQICEHNCLNRDAYYKMKTRNNERLAIESKIIEMVNDSSVENGITHAELSWILESNKAMITMLEDIGGVVDKTYRIYEKPL